MRVNGQLTVSSRDFEHVPAAILDWAAEACSFAADRGYAGDAISQLGHCTPAALHWNFKDAWEHGLFVLR